MVLFFSHGFVTYICVIINRPIKKLEETLKEAVIPLCSIDHGVLIGYVPDPKGSGSVYARFPTQVPRLREAQSLPKVLLNCLMLSANSAIPASALT